MKSSGVAVIDSAIADWVRGPARQKSKAEFFLFQDEEDFPFVCHSAGLNPRHRFVKVSG